MKFTIQLLEKTIKVQNRLLYYHKTVLVRLGKNNPEQAKAAYDSIDRTIGNIKDLKRSLRILRAMVRTEEKKQRKQQMYDF